ncbi:Acyl-protein thioesterase 1 [Paramyrothecium foliicola]|nr:Acyl-protein thioesterase 1 [Paramyrothecium foliicola]
MLFENFTSIQSSTGDMRAPTTQGDPAMAGLDLPTGPLNSARAGDESIEDARYIIRRSKSSFHYESALLEWLRNNTTIPVPKPLHQGYDDKARRFYEVFEKPGGVALCDCWDDLSAAQQDKVILDLRTHLQELRSITPAQVPNAVARDRFLDPRDGDVRGPYSSTEEFLNAIATRIDRIGSLYDAASTKKAIRFLNALRALPSDHGMMFTHGNFSPENILIDQDGKVVAILNWSEAGYAPAFWEYVKSYLDDDDSNFYLNETPDRIMEPWPIHLRWKLAPGLLLVQVSHNMVDSSMPSEAEPKSSASSKRITLGDFPPPTVRPPLEEPHKTTVIFLHGRGSSADKFCDPILSTQTQEHGTFQKCFPNTKFVFPTAPLMRATKYRRSIMHQWYDGSGDWEPEARGNMRETVEFIHALLREEIRLLDGDASKIVLAGISQGCSMTLTCLLLWGGDPLGATVGMCGFMPITAPLLQLLNDGGNRGEMAMEDDVVFETDAADGAATGNETVSGGSKASPAQDVVNALWEEAELPGTAPPSSFPFRSTPVFLGHGQQDEEVDYRHTCEAVSLLAKLDIAVEFHLYPDLGHWYSAEMLSNIVTFLKKHTDL